MKKLIQTINIDDLLVSGGIFTKISNIEGQPFTWLTNDVALELDNDYYLSHSGDKVISPFVRRLETLKDDGKILDVLLKVANYIIQKYRDKWNKVYDAFIESNYNPIENYSMVQVETPDIKKTSNAKTNTDVKTTTHGDSSTDTYGFNSANSVPTGKAEADTDVTVTGNKDNNYTDVEETETGTRRLTRSGNIGVTTSQQMLQSEIELRKFNFVDMIMNDVDMIMCLHVYE